MAVTVQGGVTLNFNPPVALGPDPGDKHHYWWMEIGNIVRFVIYGCCVLQKEKKH
jgi:hypothetical protein